MASLEEQTGNHPFGPDPPGTILLEKVQQASRDTILHPVPTADPNDPLNWHAWRKFANFSFCLLYVLLTYAANGITFTSWGQVRAELGFSVAQLNSSAAFNLIGLGTGAVFFVPLVHKYGRRPGYIASSLMQLGGCVWLARMRTVADLWLGNLLLGLGGAAVETITQVTISDIFFVHQHAAMNAYGILFTSIGAFLGPVAAGYIVDSQGWRWIWWWCVILEGAATILIAFLFEESKFTPSIPSERPGGVADATAADDARDNGADAKKTVSMGMDRTVTHRFIDRSIPKRPYWKRMAFVTITPGSAYHNLLDPVRILFTFAGIAYAAVTFGGIIAIFNIVVSVQAEFLLAPPYNFTAAGVGLMNLAPLIGTLPGVCVGGHLNDVCIIWLSKRNGGMFEPEMRLWFMLPAAVLTPIGVLMVGLGINYKVAWPVLAVGFGVIGFVMAIIASLALSYAMDSYTGIIGTAMIGIIFVRNLLGVAVLFALEPWIQAMGLGEVHIIVAVVIFLILLLPVPLLIWGKKARAMSAKAYYSMAQRQPTYREA